MSSEHPEELNRPQLSRAHSTSDGREEHDAEGRQDSFGEAGRRESIVVVRGETVRDPDPNAAPKDSRADSAPKDRQTPARSEVSDGKVRMQSRLPTLDDDGDVGVQREHVVIRDGEADLSFSGTLLASVAPPSAPKGRWQEYRIYETTGGKHVFSRVTRNVVADEEDVHEAQVFDPSPTSVSSQLLRGARDLTRSRPLTWRDAAVSFFGYDPLAKALYRKLGGQFEERIS
jgi:hypothetical protein